MQLYLRNFQWLGLALLSSSCVAGCYSDIRTELRGAARIEASGSQNTAPTTELDEPFRATNSLGNSADSGISASVSDWAGDSNDGGIRVEEGSDTCLRGLDSDAGDTDSDGVGDDCDSDDDNDGVSDTADNCPLKSNAAQKDADDDGVGDACDGDDDNDGVSDTLDNCPFTSNALQTDEDGDGIGAGCDGCDGVNALGLCWYLGAMGQSCSQACAGRGGTEAEAASTVGTPAQGGNLAACGTVLTALGYPSNPLEATSSEREGLGCHLWSNGVNYWLTDPQFSVDASLPEARVACSCNE